MKISVLVILPIRNYPLIAINPDLDEPLIYSDIPVQAKAFINEELVAVGLDGADGARGSVWTSGAGAPTSNAEPHDQYLDTQTGDVYEWV